MYSVMLAAMLTTTSAAPAWGCHGCYGCFGCHSGYGCSGYAYCHGCCGGCYGYGYNAFSYGCSCSGCSGYGCWGCSGGCYGGCYGGVTYLGVVSCSCSGSGGGFSGDDARMRTLEKEVRALKEQNRQLRERMQHMGGKPGGKPRPKPEGEVSAPAHVVIKLPADARLFVDGKPCPLTSGTRTFDTPALEPGAAYSYTLRAEVTRDGRPVSVSKRVSLRAGEESVVEFGDLAPVLTTAGR